MPDNANAFILKELSAHAEELRELVRNDPEFARRLYDALEQLARAENEASSTRAVDDLLEILLSSPLAAVAKGILQHAELQAAILRSREALPRDPELEKLAERVRDLAAAANRLAYAVAPYKAGPPQAEAAEEESVNWVGGTGEAPPTEGELLINAWISERQENPEEPLQTGHAYTLNFNVGRMHPATLVRPDDAALPESDIPPGGLLTEWLITSASAELSAFTRGVNIEVKTGDGGALIWIAKFSLLVQRGQESETIQLSVVPHADGESEVDILILAASQVYRHLSIGLTAYSGGEPESRDPAVMFRTDTYLTPAAHLNLRTTHEWTTPPGELTIQVLPVGLAAVYGDVAGQSIGTSVPWTASPPLMAGKMENVRSAMDRLRAKWEAYLNDIDLADLELALKLLASQYSGPYDWSSLPNFADAAHQQRWSDVEKSAELRELAVYGHQLYDAVFPPQTELRNWMDHLQPGHRVNIVWQGAGVSDVPWGLMYLPDPPDPGDPVDATGFLALRLRMEYRPFFAQGGAKNLGDLQHAARAFFFYWGDKEADPAARESQWQRSQWGSLTNHVVVPASAPAQKQDILNFFKTKQELPVTVLYMFCHCTVGEGNSPVLRFGNTNAAADVIKGTDLTRPLPDRPLVFMNACTSSASDPYKVNDLESYFFNSGCRAYVGTEAKVPIEFASRFATLFFAFLFRLLDDAPMAAGEAVAQTRLYFWTRYRNIGGLFYSYVNQYELYLAEDAEVRALRR